MGTQLGFDFDAPPAPSSASASPAFRVRDPHPAEPRPSGVSAPAEVSLSERLGRRLGKPVRVSLTNNRRVMLSARRHDGWLVVRLHRMFLAGDEPVVDALARYLERRDPEATRTLETFVEANRTGREAPPRRRVIVRPRGRVHDLARLFEGLSERHFGGRLDVAVTWGRRTAPRRGKRSIQLGTYCPEDNLIRIHPALDQEWVPEFYVESVLFHEMLHRHMGAEQRGSMHCFHTPAFRERERSFEQHDLALAWEKQHLGRLLRS